MIIPGVFTLKDLENYYNTKGIPIILERAEDMGISIYLFDVDKKKVMNDIKDSFPAGIVLKFNYFCVSNLLGYNKQNLIKYAKHF